MHHREYVLLTQVTLELQVAWLVDAYGDQLPSDQLKEIAKSIIDKRLNELRDSI